MLQCRVQTQDAAGKWVAAAVKCMPYQDALEKFQANREIAAMEDMTKNAFPTVPILSEDTLKVDGQWKKFIAVRYELTQFVLCSMVGISSQLSTADSHQ